MFLHPSNIDRCIQTMTVMLVLLFKEILNHLHCTFLIYWSENDLLYLVHATFCYILKNTVKQERVGRSVISLVFFGLQKCGTFLLSHVCITKQNINMFICFVLFMLIIGFLHMNSYATCKIQEWTCIQCKQTDDWMNTTSEYYVIFERTLIQIYILFVALRLLVVTVILNETFFLPNSPRDFPSLWVYVQKTVISIIF